MIGTAAPRHPPVELTHDPSFERRIQRLAIVSAIALGSLWGLAISTLEAPPAVDWALAAGALLMPLTLAASLLRPRLRYALVLPASLVAVGLLAVCVGWLPSNPRAAAGWILMTAGVAFGGVLGMWLWYRLLPVPASLDQPFSRGRWALVGVHVTLVVAGLALAAWGIR